MVRTSRIPIAVGLRNDVVGATGIDGRVAVRVAGALPGVTIVVVGGGILMACA